MRYVSRDPFARFTTYTAREYDSAPCAWCSSWRYTPTQRRYTLRFIVDEDSGRRSESRRLYCCRSCAESDNA